MRFTDQTVCQSVRGENGHIVNAPSLGGLLAVPLKAPYVAAKHALVGLSQNLRAEFRMIHAPIGVTVVCPGPVATGIIDKQRDRYDGPTQISEAGQEEFDHLKDALDNVMSAPEAREI